MGGVVNERMNTKNLAYIKEKLKLLKGLPLRNVSRICDMLGLGMGGLIERESAYHKFKYGESKTVSIGEYALHISCTYRIRCGNDIILGKEDRFQPSRKLLGSADFDWERFNDDSNAQYFDKLGNNRMDEIISMKFNELDGFIIDFVKVGKLGDISISFANNFIIEVYVDTSSDNECWRFFKANSDDHLVVTSKGIEA